MSFDKKVVIVTGASSGIGAATAIAFSKEGASVVMVGRNETKLKDIEEKCKSYSKNVLVVKADVSKGYQLKEIIGKTINEFGKIDILINNAGFAKSGSIEDGNVVEAYDAVMATNVRAVIQLTKLATPHLKQSKGSIVNISSIASSSTPHTPDMLPYAISKAALDSFTRGAAKELATLGIRVNSVNPGPVKTDFAENSGMKAGDPSDFMKVLQMIPLKRISEPEELADLVLFLSSDKARGITGSLFVVDNGCLVNNW